jgi:hypothetical protein
MREFGKVLTADEIAAVPTPSKAWVEPTGLQPVPTPEEMANWFPSEVAEDRRFRWEQNVTTGERKAIELTLEEYRARHVAKIVSKNEYVVRKAAEAVAARRKAVLDRLIDAELAKA